jgi:hypothetical protein
MQRRAALHNLLRTSVGWLVNRRVVLARAGRGSNPTGTARSAPTLDARMGVVAEDLHRGYGSVAVTLPSGGMASGSQIGIQTWMPRTLNVRDFGAVGDGLTDDTAAIQRAIDAAIAIDTAEQTGLGNRLQHGGATRVHAEGVFRISAKVTIGCDFEGSRATFLVRGAPAVAVSVSAPTSADNPTGLVARRHINLPEVINTANLAPPNCTGIGIQIVNAQFCKFSVQKVERFAVGLALTASNDGSAWNRFELTWFYNNNIGLDIGYGLDGSTSYVNENQFWGGSFSISGGRLGTPGTRYIRVGRNNSNTFYSTALEGDVPEYHIECAGRFNLWLMPRFEGSAAAPRVRFNNISGAAFSTGCDNAIMLGYITGGSALDLTNAGAYAARNAVLAWQPGAIGGISHQHSSEYFDGDLGSGLVTLYIDAINHRVAVGKTTAHELLSLRGNRNIDFNGDAFLGQTYSNDGLLLGWIAKADTASNVGDRVIASQASSAGVRYILVTAGGIRFHASNSPVTAAQDVSAVGEKLLIDDIDDVIVRHKLKAPGLGGYVRGDRYLVIDAAGHVHVSSVGPGS